MAGGPYNIPRNTKGEGRFFYIFSTKALIYTGVLGAIGACVCYPFGAVFGNHIITLVGAVVGGVIGFVVSSFKIPESNNFEITRKAGGEYIDQIIIRYFKFKMKKNKIYTSFTDNDEKNTETSNKKIQNK